MYIKVKHKKKPGPRIGSVKKIKVRCCVCQEQIKGYIGQRYCLRKNCKPPSGIIIKRKCIDCKKTLDIVRFIMGVEKRPNGTNKHKRKNRCYACNNNKLVENQRIRHAGKKFIKCSKCKKKKSITKFYKNSQCWCKDCHAQVSRRTYCKNPEKFIKWAKRWKYKILKKDKDYFKRHMYKFNKSKKGRYRIYKVDASKRNIKFILSFETFVTFWQKPCAYCNEEIETIGLDRVNNNLGYTKRNIVSCCCTCNRMKRNNSTKDFIERCQRITEFYKKTHKIKEFKEEDYIPSTKAWR